MLPITQQADHPSGLVEKLKRRLIVVIYLSLGLGNALSFFALSKYFTGGQPVFGTNLFGFWGLAIWGIAIFVVLIRLAYLLELNMVNGYYQLFASISLLVTICSLAAVVFAVVLGFLDVMALVITSSLLSILCVLFAQDFFSKRRLSLLLRLLFSGFIIGLLIASFFFIF